MERYFNNYQTTVSGGYTSGSGVLNVLSTSGITLNAGDTARLTVYTGSPEIVVILVASAVNSGTQFAVTAEGADVSASAGDLVLNTQTVGGMNQIRSDISLLDTYANLPNTGSTHLVKGQRFKCTDAPYEFIFDGTNWNPFALGVPVVIPPAMTFVNTTGAGSVSNTSGFLSQTVVGSTGTHLNYTYVAQPATPYTIDVLISTDVGNPPSALGDAIIGIGFSDGTKLLTFHIIPPVAATPGELQVNRWSNATTFSANEHNGGSPQGFGQIWMRMVNDGTNLTFYIGDAFGLTWSEFYSEAVGAFLTPTRILFVMDSQATGVGGTFHGNLISWYTH